MMVAVSDLQGRDEVEINRKFLLRAIRYNSTMVGPLFVALVCFADPVMRLWLGTPNPFAAYYTRILAVGIFLNALVVPSYHYVAGLGFAAEIAWVTAIYLVANVVLSVGLIFSFGPSGVVFGTTLSIAIATCYFNLRVDARSGYPVARHILSCVWRPLGISLVCSALSYPWMSDAGRENPVAFLIGIVIYCASTLILFCACRMVTIREYDLLEPYLPAPVARIANWLVASGKRNAGRQDDLRERS